eukprot:389544-Ditylum_brightwellii.AAC.1
MTKENLPSPPTVKYDTGTTSSFADNEDSENTEILDGALDEEKWESLWENQHLLPNIKEAPHLPQLQPKSNCKTSSSISQDLCKAIIKDR